MFAAVGPAPGVGVGESVVRSQVDDPDAGRQRLGDGARRAVREREEDDVDVDPGKGRGVEEDPAGEIGKVRVDVGDVQTGRRTRRQWTDLDVWMPEQQTEQLPTCVATCPGNRGCHPHD